MYGCLYQTSFDANYPSKNQLVCDGDSSSNSHFLIEQKCYSSTKYILVVTTYLPYKTGHYFIDVKGPSKISMIFISPTSKTTTTTIMSKEYLS